MISTTRLITSHIIEKLLGELKHIAKDKTSRYVLMTVNPVGYLMGAVMAKKAESSTKLTDSQRDAMRESALIAQNPFSFGIGKVLSLFRKKRDIVYEFDV